MPQPPAKQFSGIFVSYRRDDSSGHAGRLSDRLVEHFGKDRIFMDIDTIEPGEDFVTVIENAVGSCEILIAIIGRNWLSGGGNTGRLDNPNDFVRLEIATALSRDIRVIPVLVQRASMPKPQDLPDDLAKFTRRNAVELSDLRWQSDVDQLISVMERVLVKREEAVRLAEAARQTEEERQRRDEGEKRRVNGEKQRLAEDEAKQRAAEEQRRKEEERERRETEYEALEASRRRAEEERIRAEAEERSHESNLAATQKLLDEPSTAITAGDVSTPAYKNRRVVLIAVASLIVLVVAAVLIWRTQRDRNSSGITNQTAVVQPSLATQPSPGKSSQTPAPAKPSPTAGAVVQNQMGIELVYVPAGSFMMGANSLYEFETPAHQVTFKESFYMGKYEVTQAQWKSVMGTNPSSFKGNNLPVEQVLWNEVKEFVRKLNEMNDGYAYRLPSEAEWEYACRAGTTGDYPGKLSEMAWYSENSGNKTHAVGGKQPNAWGLADMHGNVWEWCQDSYHDSYNGAPTDGSAWLGGGDQKSRVLRGGSFVEEASDLRCAHRWGYSTDYRLPWGFRVVAVVRSA